MRRTANPPAFARPARGQRPRAVGRGLGFVAWLVATVTAFASLAPPARAGDSKADAAVAARLAARFRDADDPARAALVEEAVGAAGRASLDAFLAAATTSCDLLVEVRRLQRRLDEWDAEHAGAPAGAADAAAAKAERKSLDAQEKRETAGLALLAAGAGRAFDALPDAEASSFVPDWLEAAGRATRPGVFEWAGDALGAMRRERTTALAVAGALDAVKDARKQLAAREAPARKLADLQQKIADVLRPFLRKRQEAGDYSGKIPTGLIDAYEPERRVLEREVARIQALADRADARRETWTRALATHAAALAPDGQAAVLLRAEADALRHADPAMRVFGVGAISTVKGERAFAQLQAAAASPEPVVLAAALAAIGSRPEPEAVDLVARTLKDARWPVRAASAAALAATGRAAAVPFLLDALDTAEGRSLDDLKDALSRLTGRAFAASALPWRRWWETDGATFRGPRDEPLPGLRPDGTARRTGEALDEGGTVFYGITTHSTRVLFVLDVSGSMNFPGTSTAGGRKKLEVLKSEMKRSITGLPDGATFGVVTFSHDVSVWRKEPTLRNKVSVEDAHKFVDRLEAIGATNIHDALERAFAMATPPGSAGRTAPPLFDTVFFLTDGKPTAGKVVEPAAILRDVRRWNEGRELRIHVIGAGGKGTPDPGGPGPAPPAAAGKPPESDLDEKFLADLAAQNGGTFVLR